MRNSCSQYSFERTMQDESALVGLLCGYACPWQLRCLEVDQNPKARRSDA